MAFLSARSKSSNPSRLAPLLFFATAILTSTASGLAQQVRSREDLSRILTIENVSIADGSVSGAIYNRLPHAVRDVQLFIRHTWLWDNETKPGKDDPGTSVYQTLSGEIPPGGHLPFKYRPSPPLPQKAGGRFETTVAVAGYSEIIPQSR